MIHPAIALALLLAAWPAAAHDWYHTLKIPGSRSPATPEGLSCCDNRDCAPAHARHTPLGWEAETPQGDWVEVPDRTIVRDATHPAGSAVLCWRPLVGTICFVPPAAGG